MDPVTLTTTAAAGALTLDGGALVDVAVALLAVLGAPWWVSPAVRLAAALLRRLGRRAPAGAGAARTPAAISDGETAEDLYRPEAHPEVTAPIDLTKHTGDAG